MTTPYTNYTEVYGRFLSKIRDIPLQKIMDKDRDFAEKMMHRYLVSATAHFTYSNKNLSDRNEDSKKFNIILNDLEIEILSMFMVYAYLNQFIISTDKIVDRLSSKDFRSYSPANLMNEIREVQTANYDRAVELMVENYYRGWTT